MKTIIILSLLILLLFPLALEGTPSLVKITVNTANVRTGANLNSEIITMVQKGTILESISKIGDWYLVNLPKDIGITATSGYIHYSCIEEIQASQEPTVKPAQPPAPQARFQRFHTPNVKKESLFSGFFIKFGALFAPGPVSFSHAWLPAFGYDFSLSSNFSVGFELQPAIRSFPELNFTQIPLMVFGNVKGGIEFFRHLKVFGGAGAGTVASFESLSLVGGNVTEFNVNFAFQFLSGIEYELKTISLILEYQIKSILYQDAVWGHYILFGVRF